MRLSFSVFVTTQPGRRAVGNRGGIATVTIGPRRNTVLVMWRRSSIRKGREQNKVGKRLNEPAAVGRYMMTCRAFATAENNFIRALAKHYVIGIRGNAPINRLFPPFVREHQNFCFRLRAVDLGLLYRSHGHPKDGGE